MPGMKIGILADSHGRAARTGTAIRTLEDAGAEFLIHLGDIETESVIDEMVGRDTRIVFGNMDWNVSSLTSYAQSVGITVDHPIGRVTIDGKVIAFTHGDQEPLMRDALAEGVDYLLHGHSHTLRDERVGETRIINPGALCRARRYTAAVLDPASDDLRILEIER